MGNSKSSSELVKIIFGLILTVLIGLIAILVYSSNKTSVLGWIILFVLLLVFCFLQYRFAVRGFKMVFILAATVLISVGVVFFITTDIGKDSTSENSNNSPTSEGTDDKTSGKTDESKSSVVSIGVDKTDLGNIINGQYFFDDGTNIYYSTYDDTYYAHIFRQNKKTGNTEVVFDGFGWSLVVRGEYLYFSGNSGQKIDGTYNLFKLKLSDNSFEIINDQFCYGMSFYNNWLYYINLDTSGNYSYMRLNVDSGVKETLVQNGSGKIIVVYNNKIYYKGSEGFVYKADVDGSNSEVVIDELCSYFIIGNNKIAYTVDQQIKTCKIDGSSREVIRIYNGNNLGPINSFEDDIFYVEYINNEYDYTVSGYKYSLNRISFDGFDDEKIYEAASYGVYINIIDGKAFALDYIQDSIAGHPYQVTVLYVMNRDGSNLKLYK